VERHQTVQRTRIDMMRQFAESRSCRGQALLAYFGDGLDASCGHCDNCVSGQSSAGQTAEPTALRTSAVPSAQPTPAPRPAPEPTAAGAASEPAGVPPVGGVVRHRAWGAGTVLGYEGDRMTVLFDSVGYKTLSVGVVRERELLVTE
jgi:ATP-dependent DNA helicase RecQ